MNFIDAHSHVWTPDTASYPLAAGFARERMTPPSFTDEELMRLAEPVGVNRVVLIQMSFYGFDNRYMLDAIERHPERFAGVGVIDQDGPHPAAAMRQLKGRGVRGFRIYPKNQRHERWLDSPTMHELWATGAAENLAMCCLINPCDLPALDRMCADYPETPVVVDHLGRVGATGKVDPQDVRMLCNMARHKNVMLKISAFYALGRKQPPYHDLGPLIKQVFDAFGGQRLMWATDCPFQTLGGHTYKDSIDLIHHGLDFLTDDDRQWLLRKTAERVFFQ